jgi:serine/threonine-protein phosphatase 2A regulatory subunit B
LVTENSIAPNNNPVNTLRLPKLTHHDTIVAAVPRKVYSNGKTKKNDQDPTYCIN